MTAGYEKALNVPKYIGNGVKQLEKLLEEYREFGIVEGEASQEKKLTNSLTLRNVRKLK